jgi:hypothetical protein
LDINNFNQFCLPSPKERLKEDRRHYFQRHYYVVTNRLEHGEQVWVRAEYAPEAVKSSCNSS